MYHQFFGLSKDPFSMTPDPAFLFLTLQHREALAGVTYAILNRKGFVVLIGDAGTGKTTLLRTLFQSIPSTRVRLSVVLNPMLTPAEFLELALLDFGIKDIPASKAQRLTVLQQFLIEAYRERQVAVLVVDEAHKLPLDVLEEIRLLSNFELAEAKLLQIVLAGQTELGDMLNRQDLRQLKQRIAVRLVIHPLSSIGVEHYIQHRWQKAGATRPHPFPPDVVARVAQCSRGIPRLVNALCSNALMLWCAEGHATIGAAQIVEVARDLDLLDAPRGPRPALGSPPLARTIVEREGNTATAVKRPVNGVVNEADPEMLLIRFPTLESVGHQSDATDPSWFTRLAGKLSVRSEDLKKNRG
jgi:general secretion pathway protein A